MKCQRCDQLTAGKSKYCATHRAEARAAFKAMIADKEQQKIERNEAHHLLFDLASKAAQEAYFACNPTPMVVYETVGFSDTPKPDGKQWYVSDGVCGFAWVKITPATSSFCRWLSNKKLGYKSYTGGWDIPVHCLVPTSGQSLERAEHAARAAVKILREHNVNCRVHSRLD